MVKLKREVIGRTNTMDGDWHVVTYRLNFILFGKIVVSRKFDRIKQGRFD